MRKEKLYYLFTVGILSLFLIFGCSSREPLLDRALIPTDAAPHISNISPDENLNNVPINTLIHIEFPDPMDTDSVENNTYLKYDDTIIDKSNLSFTWDTTKTLLTIDPLIDLPPGTEITVVIETGAVNQQGIHLIEPFTCTFTTTTSDQPDTTSPTIIAFNPSSLQVTDTEVQIQVTFSEEMSHISVEKTFILASTDNQEIYIYTNGSFSWNGTTMIFTPESSLSMDKEYIISFSTSTDIVPQDLAGNQLTGSTSSRFYTLENKVYVSPTNGDDNNPGYHKTLPVKTIARGIQRAVTYGYDLVKIEEGIYTETINLGTQEAGITIEGAYVSGTNFNSRDIDNKPTIIQSPTSEYSITTSDTSNIKFDGVLIKGGIAGGIKIQNCSNVTLIYCTIYGSETTANSAEGLIASDSNSINIIDSTIYGANGASITGDVYGIKASSSSVSVSSSTISSLEAGAYASGASYSIYIDNTSNTTASLNIQSSDINQSGSGGDTSSYGVFTDGADIDITGSTIYGGNSSSGYSFGIYINQSNNGTISGNTITGGVGTTSYGVYVEGGSSDITISVNSIKGGTAPTSYGVYIYNSSIAISGNTLITGDSGSNTNYGIYAFTDDSAQYQVTISNNTDINGGSGTTSNYGIYITGIWDSFIVENNENITGGFAGEIYGIYVENANPIIQNNSNISAGSTSSNQSHGIYITNSSSPTIKDNDLIYGGSNNGGDTYGIKVESNSTPQIYRNTIVGGEETEGGTGTSNYGVHYSSILNSILSNNFIIGSSQTTDTNNNTFGVYIDDSEIKILNNTINGGGNTSSTYNSYSIYGKSTTGTWNVTPIIVNNIIIGGNTSTTYGMYFEVDTSSNPMTCAIFNNVFNDEKCTHLVSTLSADINDKNALNGSFGSVAFDPDPKDNIEYQNDSDLKFVDISVYDYHIDSELSNSVTLMGISTNGFDDESDPDYNNNNIYSPPEAALYDIDGEARPTDYSNIDLGADEFN